MTPGPWAFALLALAAFRVWKLAADDAILDRPRDWLLARAGTSSKLALFLVCPWCAGFWITVAWWAAWWTWPHWTLAAAAPFALSAAVGLLASALDAVTDRA